MKWNSRIVGHERVAAGQLMANPFNHRLHPPAQREVVAASIAEVGFVKSVIVNRVTGHIVDGHERVMQALGFGEQTLVDVEFVELSPDEEKKVLLVLDASSELAGVDRERLADLAADCEFSFDVLAAMAASMVAESESVAVDGEKPPSLSERFGAVPFSVFLATDEIWASRRAGWAAVGAVGAMDPVLAELALRWFVPPGGVVLDPFGTAGLGVVGEPLGRVPLSRVPDSTLPVDGVVTLVEPKARLSALKAACGRLADDRFVCVAVAGPRDASRGTVDRVGEIVRCCEQAGCRYYNEAVLVVAGEPDLSGFASMRLLGSAHVLFLVFVKGDARRATAAVGDVECAPVPVAGEEFGEVMQRDDS